MLKKVRERLLVFSCQFKFLMLLYNYIFQEFLALVNRHELTPPPPSLLRKEGSGDTLFFRAFPLFAGTTVKKLPGGQF
jgi:hypothetical protein